MDNKAKKEAVKVCDVMENKGYTPVFQKTVGSLVYMLFIGGPPGRYILTISSSLGSSYCNLKETTVESL